MRSLPTSTVVMLVFGVIVLGAVIGLAAAPVAPHPQAIEKQIPDDHIPH